METTKKTTQNNPLEDVYEEFVLDNPGEPASLLVHNDDPMLAITALCLSDGRGTEPLRFNGRRIFDVTEGLGFILKLYCNPGAQAFIDAWNKHHSVVLYTKIGKFEEEFELSLYPDQVNPMLLTLHMRPSDGFIINYTAAYSITINAGCDNEFSNIYSFKVFELPVDLLNFTVMGSTCTFYMNDSSNYYAIKKDEREFVIFTVACANMTESLFFHGIDEVEYEIVISDGDRVLHTSLHRNEDVMLTDEETDEYICLPTSVDISALDKGKYYFELYFMGRLQHRRAFEVGDANVEYRDKEYIYMQRSNDDASGKSSLDALNSLVGLAAVKRDITANINYLKLAKAREAVGLKNPKRLLNMVFTGSPGTGKTTVCRLFGSILHRLGLLSSGHVTEVNRAGLVGRYIGESESRTKAAIEQAKGGVLFIDEAYALIDGSSDGKDYGMRVIDTLMPYLSEPDDMIVVLAGYEKEMHRLLDSNPGLSSRFPVRYHFDDYSPAELMEIAKQFLLANQYAVSPAAENKLMRLFEMAVTKPNFGNGRYVKTLLENTVIPNMANRLVAADALGDVDRLSKIEDADIPENVAIAGNPKRNVIGFNQVQYK